MLAEYRQRMLLLSACLMLAWTGCTGSLRLEPGPSAVSSGIRFLFIDPDAQGVSIAGTFNDWDSAVHFLSEGPPGHWSIVLSLPPGRYEYMFVIDQRTWVIDPGAEMTVHDGFGRRNSLLVVD